TESPCRTAPSHCGRRQGHRSRTHHPRLSRRPRHAGTDDDLRSESRPHRAGLEFRRTEDTPRLSNWLCQTFFFRLAGACARSAPVQPDDVTPLLHRIGQGDPSAADQLLPLVYDELRRLAAARMARESSGQTLQATALVHEAWLRLGGDRQPAWANRAHFFAAAAEAMRRILIDRARR